MFEPGSDVPTQDRFKEGTIKTEMGYASDVKVGEKGVSVAIIDNDGLLSAEVRIFA